MGAIDKTADEQASSHTPYKFCIFIGRLHPRIGHAIFSSRKDYVTSRNPLFGSDNLEKKHNWTFLWGSN